jgi:hypothetical protein
MTRGRRKLVATITLEQNEAGGYVARACIADQPILELDPSRTITASFDELAQHIAETVKGARTRAGK